MNSGRLIHTDYLAADSPEIAEEDLKFFACSEIGAVRRRVAENVRTPTNILAKMAQDRDPQVRIAVGLNTATPYLVLSRMIYDDSSDVRLWLASTSYLPKHLILELAKDPNPYVSHRARRTAMLVQSRSRQARLSIVVSWDKITGCRLPAWSR
ncbi:MAG: hypothetical protein JSS86_24725 [Cyanobacteria bacterium SZAS LIN-2]|nr:hypothetical protein [Cyanobacteria bacterium SZAS LIN-2]